jgi:twitching motility protein PilT
MARIDPWFDAMLAQKGSDLHVAVGMPPMARVRGELTPLGDRALAARDVEAMLLEICDEVQRQTILDTRDLDFAWSYGERSRFRANYFYKSSGLAAVFRTIPTKVLSLEQLGTPEAVRRLALRRTGLVLVTGPTGSGKSTTLAAMIDHINQVRACHVLTIEDPVEFVHQPKRAQITHREIGPDASSFAAAMRSAGREDPNVILIGELRTNETMKLALQLASFGVLVFGTVHTNSAPATVDRIVNAFPSDEQPQIRSMLAECLAGIVAQQLVKTADGNGRVAALEILLGSSGVSSMIRDNKTFQLTSTMQAGRALGMQTMDMALEALARAGTITPEDALEKASDKESFGKLVAR